MTNSLPHKYETYPQGFTLVHTLAQPQTREEALLLEKARAAQKAANEQFMRRLFATDTAELVLGQPWHRRLRRWLAGILWAAADRIEP